MFELQLALSWPLEIKSDSSSTDFMISFELLAVHFAVTFFLDCLTRKRKKLAFFLKIEVWFLILTFTFFALTKHKWSFKVDHEKFEMNHSNIINIYHCITSQELNDDKICEDNNLERKRVTKCVQMGIRFG